jgi:hypothetical protein
MDWSSRGCQVLDRIEFTEELPVRERRPWESKSGEINGV